MSKLIGGLVSEEALESYLVSTFKCCFTGKTCTLLKVTSGRPTDTQTAGKTYTYTDGGRQTEIHIDGNLSRQTKVDRNRQTDRQKTDRKSDRKTDKKTVRDTDRTTE